MRIAGILACFSLALAGQQPILLQTQIHLVRLYPGEAWVTRSGRISLPSSGNHRIQIGGLPEGLTLDDVRIQSAGPAGTTLGEMRIGPEPPRTPDSLEAKQLLAHLSALHDRKALLEAQEAASTQASGFLDAYQQNLAKAGSSGPVPTPGVILDTSRSLEARYVELIVQSQARKVEMEKIDQEMKPLEASWQALQAKLGADRTPTRLTVELILAKPGEVQIELSTRTPKARWKPSYEARLSPGGQVELSLFAVVSQLSGEAWDRVRLEISSANLNQIQEGRTFPQDVRLNWTPPPPVYPGDRRGMAGATVEVNATQPSLDSTSTQTGVTMRTSMSPGAYAPPPPPLPVLEPVANLGSSAEGLFKTYVIEGLKDLPSDGEARRYKVAAVALPAQQVVVVAPRLDPTPYLVVRFQLPPEIPLFPGSPIFRYLGQQRLGQGILALPPAGQPMQLSMGAFHGLRTKLVNLGQTQPFQTIRFTQVRQIRQGVSQESVKEEVITKGGERVWTSKDQFILSNDSDEPLNIELQDRLVASVHESVSVRLTMDTTPGSEEVPSEHLRRWQLTIPPRTERHVELGLEVRAPKDGRMVGLEALGLK